MGYYFANFQISSLEVEIAELREVCIKEKHIDPDKDDRVNYVIKELEDQIQVFMHAFVRPLLFILYNKRHSSRMWTYICEFFAF